MPPMPAEFGVLLKLAESITVEKAAALLLLAAALYIVVRTIRLRKMTLPQRRAEDARVKKLEEAVKKMKDDAEAEVRKLRSDVSTVEGIARNAVAKVEAVGEDFVALKEYVHDMSHGLREELQSMTRAIGQVEGSLSGLSENVGRVLGVLMTK